MRGCMFVYLRVCISSSLRMCAVYRPLLVQNVAFTRGEELSYAQGLQSLSKGDCVVPYDTTFRIVTHDGGRALLQESQQTRKHPVWPFLYHCSHVHIHVHTLYRYRVASSPQHANPFCPRCSHERASSLQREYHALTGDLHYPDTHYASVRSRHVIALILSTHRATSATNLEVSSPVEWYTKR